MKQFDILKNVDRALVIGDVHGNFTGLLQAVEFTTRNNNMFMISLGDIVDYGIDNDGCVMMMDKMIEANRAAMVIGNHDWKLYRYFKQLEDGEVRVQLKRGLKVTVEELERFSENRRKDFIERFRRIYKSARFHYVTRNTMFVHGGGHRNMWDVEELNSKLRSRALYGEVSGFDETNYPIRTYEWADEVPEDRTVFFGHDIRSTKNATVVGVNQNVHSMDTGSSKGGKLTGAVIEFDGVKFVKKDEISFDK